MADFLSIGTSGLTAYRRSLEVTGNNIVNANTEGYARRDVQLQGVGDAALSPTNLRMGSGSGVAVDVIRRATDIFVQSEKRLTQSASSAATAFSERLERLEKGMFSGDGDLGKLSQTLFSRLQDFASSPSSIAVRQTVIQSAQNLADGFNAQARRLANESSAIITDAQAEFDDLNILTKQLAEINKQLDSIGADGAKANDLLDQRDKLVDSIVKIVGVTVESRPSGAVNLYLNDQAAGPQLVGPNGAKTLQAARVNGHLQIMMDPYGANIPIAPIKGGIVGGIQAFDDQVTSMNGQLDRMAVGFAKRMNDQHIKGTDLDGNRGQPLFSTDTYRITPALSNKGSATVSLDMGKIEAIEPGDYRASFSAADGQWTVVNQSTGTKAKGTQQVSIDGMTLSFSGKAADGDQYTFSPLTHAASGLRILIDDPRQLAAGLPQLAETVATNTSGAKIDLTNTGGLIDPPLVPSLDALFNQSLLPENAVSFKSDAIISTIPSGSAVSADEPVTLFSYGELSSATFQVDLTSKSWNTQTASGLNIIHSLGASKFSIDTDLGPVTCDLFPDGLPANLADAPNAGDLLAKEINRALGQQSKNGVNLGDAFYASANGNFVTINGLGDHEISYAALRSLDLNNPVISTAKTTTKASAADLSLMTREGVQIAGSRVTAGSLIRDANGKSINGFFDTASTPLTAPSAESVTNGVVSAYSYRNLSIIDSKAPLSQIDTVTNQSRSSVITFDATPESDSPTISSSVPPTVTPGAVYSLKLDGLSTPLRLAGGAIVGKNSSDLARMMFDRLNATAPQRRIMSGTLDFSNPTLASLQQASFTLTVDGKQALVTFNRSTFAQTGADLPTGTFSISWDPSIKNPPAVAISMQSKQRSLGTAPDVIANGGNTGTAQLSASFPADALAQNHPGTYTLRYDGGAGQWLVTRPNGMKSVVASLPATIDGMAINATGAPNDGDTFAVQASTSDNKVVIDLPQNLKSTPPTISITGTDATKLGLAASVASEQIIFPQAISDTSLVGAQGMILASTKQTLASLLNVPQNTIDQTADGRIIISKSIATLGNASTVSYQTTNAADRDFLASLGLSGSDLTATLENAQLTLTSSVADSGADRLADTRQSVSRVGHKVVIKTTEPGSKVPEDLLIALQQPSLTGVRRVSARFEPDQQRINPQCPDIEVKVKANGLLEIYALKHNAQGQLLRDANGAPIAGNLIATRAYQPGVPVSYMGSSFVVDGQANINDLFRITTDADRTSDNRNALALIDVGHTDLLDKGSGSFADIYAAAVGKIGSSTQAAKTAASAAKTIADNVSAAYDSATGVNLDTEAAELIKLQQAYSACAQIVNTARDLFDMLLRAF